MLADEKLERAGKLLTPWTTETNTPEANRLDIVIEPTNLVSAVKILDAEQWGYLAGITGLDLGVERGQLEVLYHFCSGASIVTLRVHTERDKASVPSICQVLPPASFYERELREMLGVEVIGLTNSDRLFLPDDWPEGIFPLRKDAVLS